MLEALPAGRPPQLVGPYRLLARLGAGGMGEVHLACRADAPTADPYRMVAVKTVRSDLEVDGDFRTRFRREIAAARTVDGPGVARLVDADADAVSPWLATEYVPGPSLAEAVVRSGALPAATVRALGIALATALSGVHGAKVLHRDLKPANVLLGTAGPKLIDFGIAQAFEATALTSTGLVVGSPGFMSPEHLAGSRAVVPASDVFCLGAVLAFAASGRGPFQDDEMAAVVYRIIRADADLTGVPEELRPVVERCLRLDPAERPTAAEVVSLLGDGVAPEAFPWPGGVLSLLAEYGEAARTAGEAAASGAGVADLPTLGPVVPYSPTAVPNRPATPPVAPVEPRRRRWGAVVAGAVAVAVVATAGVVLVNRDGEEGGGTAGPSVSNSTSPGATGTANPGPATLSRVVPPYGGRGRTNDFGTAATDRGHRPAGWSPWMVRTAAADGACSLSPKVLVCAGSGGALVGLNAADGRELWSVPARTNADGLRSTAQYPAVIGDRVYVTEAAGTVAYGLQDGEKQGTLPGPGAEWAMKGSDLADGVLHVAYVNVVAAAGGGGAGAGLVTAVQLGGSGKDVGRELWRAPLGAIPEQPVAAGGRVYVPLGTVPVALDARTGRETARGAEGCQRVTVHEKSGSVLCSGTADGSVAVLDAGSLKRQRSLGSGVTAGPAVNADGLVAVTNGQTVSVYDLRNGRQRWSLTPLMLEGDPQRVYFAGDRVITVGKREVVSVAAAGPSDDEDFERFEANVPDGFDAQATGDALAAGGAVFLALPDGLVVSGYLP
ncbi:protein kinase [Streptomyces sp. NBC_00233]|uniref:protein kinase domain-containing protein n=1 Tax=Streptomyces sp. NBC_00233 TaxID=2975686 RepID=UPI00224F84CF|nr:protein kinase [Streptomyces sp. NBC_00233]MCX5228303.1 protein kinase [Streptomyces sp. NBC_00233]